MTAIIFLILLIFFELNNSNEIFLNAINEENRIYPEKSKTYFLGYEDKSDFPINIKEKNSFLQINIHSINCKIEVSSEKGIVNLKDIYEFELYYLIVDSNVENISIKPKRDTIDGLEIENYKLKKCPLTINSYYISENALSNLTIENKEENFFYFNYSIYNENLHIIYNKTKITNYSFVALNLRFEEANFTVQIHNLNNTKQKETKNITSSTCIYLNSTFLLSSDNNDYSIISIDIIKNNNKEIPMYLKIIEEDNICLLDKNDLNFGFITSKSTYQYYYAIILEQEEGELMLHNKRLYGKLYAKIIERNGTDIKDLNNIDLYPNGTNYQNETRLVYNEHKLQLKINYNDTSICINGCYLLVTYEQIKSEGDFPLIGYEYTILSRNWNCTDSVSKLIEIPPNEYIIGCFDPEAPPEHFYFIQIPEEVEKILIQLEGNFIEAFYEQGRKKINLWNMYGDYEEITVNNSIKAIIINKTDIKENYLSFLFDYDEYSNIIFSHYYFRVIFITENDKFLSIDSFLGNPCLPERNSNAGPYYCYFKIKNEYNILNNTKFAISSENQNEYTGINISIKYNNEKLKFKDYSNFTYVYNEINSNVDYILFTFEFKNNETKNIISSFFDKIEDMYPQIYSGQMFYLDNFIKINNLKLNEDYFLKYQFIYGESGTFNYSIQNFTDINITQNFKGKPITVPLNRTAKNFSFSTDNKIHIFYYQLINYVKVKGAKEIKIGEPLTELLESFTFPLYFYYKLKKESKINMDVNIRFQKYDISEQNSKYSINGYIIDKQILLKKIKEDNTELKDPIHGTYSDTFGIGYLQVNQPININNENFLLIEINNLDKSDSFTNALSLVEISAKEYDENNNDIEYMLPVNKYIIESLDGEIRKENKYCIYIPKENKSETWIELSTDLNDIKLLFYNDSLNNGNNVYYIEKYGFRKYIINNNIYGNINFKVINENKNKVNANYLIKYSYHDINYINEFTFDNKSIEVNFEDSSHNLGLSFKYIEVKHSLDSYNNDGTGFLITGTLYNMNQTNKDLIESNYILNKITNENNSFYINKTNNYYNSKEENKNWTLKFKNVEKSKDGYIFGLQLQIQAIHNDNFLKEEFLLFKTNVILEKLKYEEPKNKYVIYIAIFVPLGVILMIVAIFFIIKFLRLKKRNDSFTKEMKSLLFSNDIQKNILINEKKLSKNESDFESTFI